MWVIKDPAVIYVFTWFLNFPGSSGGKESVCSAGDLGLIPGSGRSPGEGNVNPLQYCCLENSMGRPWSCKESCMTECVTHIQRTFLFILQWDSRVIYLTSLLFTDFFSPLKQHHIQDILYMCKYTLGKFLKSAVVESKIAFVILINTVELFSIEVGSRVISINSIFSPSLTNRGC